MLNTLFLVGGAIMVIVIQAISSEHKYMGTLDDKKEEVRK